MIECTSFQSMLLVSQIWLDMEPLQKEHQTQRFSSAITQLICVPNGKQFGRYVVNSDELRKKCVHSRGNPFSNLRSGYILTKKTKPQFRKKNRSFLMSYLLDFSWIFILQQLMTKKLFVILRLLLNRGSTR